ncbi:uroporphyrinogen-III synthase [Sphingobium boeckii]|uniref:Uroporphyrinogen-III synthase n=1 Tax=Sphingobium boeckii TaxID=1082345 RepID=A0A7W9EDX6_9SPHN|nr:uroporphyrinogen-III synthase [Sphingobium boeckii]MBB5684410.1 uroporphyrinogen-III synthase [Sphingobium boeckii]
MAPLLVLRPEPGASRTAARAKAMGLDARAAPLFEILPIAWTAPDPAGFEALLLTSANAVRQGGPALTLYHKLPVYAVGEATAQAARDAGLADVITGPGTITALLASLDPPLRLLHLCGIDRRDAARDGITITPIPVYEARAIESPGDLRGGVALVHSPRAARRLAALVTDRADMALAAISQAAAEAAGTGWASIAVAERPDDEALLAIAARLCEDRVNTRNGMTSEYLAAEPETTKPPRPYRTAMIVGLIAFALGLVAMGWIITRWNGGAGYFGRPIASDAVKQPGGAPMPVPQTAQGALTGMNLTTADLLAARIRDLELRLAQIDVRAQGAAGNAGRAESLLIAFATRRALDRGVPLGYLEGQLRDRFAQSQPLAVKTILDAARQPVTLEELQIGLEDLAPALSGGGPESDWWGSFRREISELIVIRRAGTPSPAPAERLQRARQKLGGGQVDAALAEVARMPGQAEAQNWMEAARRYIEVRRALDSLEAAAVVQPKAAALPASAPIAAPPVSAETPVLPD